MQIDVVAMIQGVFDAGQAGEISQRFADDVRDAIRTVSYPGPVRRSVCDYDKLLVALAAVEPGDSVRPEFRALELGQLWRRLGPSLASGLTVAN
jgi:hypothetical protein